MKVLVTGANGLLGHHVVFELLKNKHEVKAIVRKLDGIYFDLSKIELTKGDFSNFENLKKAATDCEAIIHIAAVTATNLLQYEDYRRVNVDGTAVIIEVANELNIKTIVIVSSANTIGFGSEQEPGDERLNIEYPFSNSFYAQSKIAAERLIVNASEGNGKHYVIINPTFMIGSYDTKPSSGKIIMMGYKKYILFIPKGGKNFVAVSDVAKTVCNALTSGRNGERYLASNVNMSFKEYYLLQKQIGAYHQIIIELPDFILNILGRIGDTLRKLGFKTDLSSINLKQLMIREYYSNKKAKRELNFIETNLRVAVKEALEWFRFHKMIDL
jgi:nucleoside-diphosphate-sugar epimerase